ncbi:MAG: ATP-dependent Clp protease proteolytic subunit [Pseudohongiellaceae bacterium]
MKLRHSAILITSLLLPAAYSQTGLGERAEARVFLDEDNQLVYSGPLEEEATAELFSLYDSAAVKPTMLVISSAGGDVQLGLDIGEWVHGNKLDVKVDQGCASSCANYIFTAGRNKYLHEHSVLVWHGGALQAGLGEQSIRAGYGETWQEWQEREARFFARIGVNPAITVYGQDKYTFLDYAWAFVRGRKIAGFDYSVDDMEKFGVSKVQLVDDEWNWREYNNSNVIRVSVEE